MKFTTKMCHSHLMSMLLMPQTFYMAVHRYNASPPNMDHEGMTGYMEVEVVFEIKDLQAFTNLWYHSYKLPSDRSKWYDQIKNATLAKCE